MELIFIKVMYCVSSPEGDMIPGLKDLLCISNKRIIITFTEGASHI